VKLALVALQALQLVFLSVHDWVPLGRFNDLEGVRRENTYREIVDITLIGAVPVTIGLAACLFFWRDPYPLWLHVWLWGTYGLLLAGATRAWWVPYLGRKDEARAKRFRTMFGSTHSFLPVRNGIAPNTLHVAFHMLLLATLTLLALSELLR